MPVRGAVFSFDTDSYYRMAVWDNSCASMVCGRAIDRPATPSRDEFPTLRISLV